MPSIHTVVRKAGLALVILGSQPIGATSIALGASTFPTSMTFDQSFSTDGVTYTSCGSVSTDRRSPNHSG